ncbi:hypothetical protein BD324DRAFT_649276 [Kockovaella imperatae]|uniref:Roadblock/LAMTOR2 domain-containing protein n=1 Tax=Kockovaella imperatae TaxID=4999 RepID=A0A1Y1UNZ1_9TREE|nr:hypothetical protein BD324DRAFT_649276 [Kockovaella imperatae]ORX39186.1 hypothetical protein BD324DRAFT_649276 [Kockovaella imperatae]
MTEALDRPNGQSTPQDDQIIDAPPELEATLARLSAYRKVRGVMILSRGASTTQRADGQASAGEASQSGILRRTGSVFEGNGGEKYASAVEDIVLRVGKAVASCEEGDEAKLMRIRTKRHELIITPNDRYLLVVLQDPES